MTSEASLIQAPICVLAVDPGLSGAILKLGRGHFDLHRDFKHPAAIANTVKALSEAGEKPNFVAVEHVHAFPKQGVVSVWSFSESTAYAKAAICLCLPYARGVEVEPQDWQQYWRGQVGLSASKDFDSRAIAAELFPSHALMFKRKKDHNSADACLIGAWALQYFDAGQTSSAPTGR